MESVSEEESQRYDRQIRVWGVEAQSRIQRSRVFVSGLRGLNAEVIKNIVLAGVNVVVHDDCALSVEHLSSLFFCALDDVGRNVSATDCSLIIRVH